MISFLYVEMICLVSVYRFRNEEMFYCIPESQFFFSPGLCGGTPLLFSQWRCKYSHNGNILYIFYILDGCKGVAMQLYAVLDYISLWLHTMGQIKHS